MNEAKKKAIDLVERFEYVETPEMDNVIGEIVQVNIGYYSAKQCALICVDEIISANPAIIGYDEMSDGSKEIWYVYNVIFWQQVKEEINKI